MAIKLRKEVREFAESMELELRANDHRGGWKDEKDAYLFGMAIQNITSSMRQEDDNYIKRKECIDAANFLMMARDNSIRALRQKTGGES